MAVIPAAMHLLSVRDLDTSAVALKITNPHIRFYGSGLLQKCDLLGTASIWNINEALAGSCFGEIVNPEIRSCGKS